MPIALSRYGLSKKGLTAVVEVGAVGTAVPGVAAVVAPLAEVDALSAVAPELVRATRHHR